MRRDALVILSGILFHAVAPAAAQDLDDFESARILRVLDLLERGSDAATGPGPAAKVVGLAASSGAITGTVHGLDPEGYGSATVMAWPADSLRLDDGEFADTPYVTARAKVDHDGTYRLERLSPGPYYVSASAKEYETRYYDNVVEQAAATIVDVPEDGTVEGIDFALERYRAGEGSIAGTVTEEADGHPISGAVVHAFAADAPHLYGMTETDDDGRYVISGLRSARYAVEVWSEDHLPELYGNVTGLVDAVLVEVVEPEQTGKIDFGLSRGGSITGVVRDASGGPIAGAYVMTTTLSGLETLRPGEMEGWIDDDPEGRLVPAIREGWAVTGEDGAYRMGGLITGEYRVQAQSSTRWFSASVWYDGVQSHDQATPVTVATGQETPGIDMTLELPAMDSGIAGRVTNPQGHPVAKVWVTVQQAVDWARMDSELAHDSVSVDDSGSAGNAGSVDNPVSVGGAESTGDSASSRNPLEGVRLPDVEVAGVSRVWAYANTDEEGYYAIEELPAGTYMVSAASESGWEYVQRWYVDASSPEDATEVILGEGERRQDIDIVLPLSVATASISGTVRDQDGNVLASAFIQMGPPEGVDPTSSVAPARLWAYGQTDAAGVYRVDRLPAGTYTVQASYNTEDHYGQSWYGGADRLETATLIVLAEGEVRAGVDIALVVRPMYGAVVGAVTDAASGSPVSRAYVELSPLDRDMVRSAPLRYSSRAGMTDESGNFALDWVPEGTYSLTVYADGGAGAFVRPDTDALQTPFQVVGGDTVRRDVALTMRHDGDGVIAGEVTTALSGPGPLEIVGEPAVDVVRPPSDGAIDDKREPWAPGGPAAVAVVIAQAVASPDPNIRYTAIAAPDGTYALRGLAPGDYVVMCFAPDHIGSYYDGAYAPDRAETVHVDGQQPVQGINFDLEPMYYWYRVLEGERAEDMDQAVPSSPAAGDGNSAAGVFGKVADESGQPVADATVYLLDSVERPVGYAQTNSDGSFELAGVMPGEYRVYASRLGYTGSYNGNQRDFAAAEPLGVVGGQLEVNLILSAGRLTAVVEEAESEAALPLVMSLRCNYPNPFNPATRITFTVPASGRARLRVYDALGQQIAVLFDQVAEPGRGHEADFRAHGLGAGIYFCALEFEGRRLSRPMTLVK